MRGSIEPRPAIRAIVVVAAFLLGGCNVGHRAVAVGPSPAPVVYAALGASDAVGYGASVPCSPQLTIADPACPGGTGYVPTIARALATAGPVTLRDFGITGAVIAPDIAAVGNRYGSQGSAAPCRPRTGGDAIVADFLTNEVPQLTGTETLVTVFAGGNDTLALANAAICMSLAGATQADVQTFIATEIAAFAADLQRLLAAIHTAAPHAAIVISNLPDLANLPFAKAPAVASARPILQAISVGIDTNAYQPAARSLGIPTVDALCDPRSYDPANYSSDGFHPNDAGYAAFASAYLAQIAATTPSLPQTSCSAMALASVAGSGDGLVPLANFERR